MKKVVHILFLAVFGTYGGYAAEVVAFSGPLSRQALTSTHVTAIAQDGHGFVWLASRNELVRFDGGRYRNVGAELNRALFSNGNLIRQLLFQSPDRLWIGSDNGLYRYDIREQTLEKVAASTGLRIYSMRLDGERIVLNTKNGIAVYRPRTGGFKELYRYGWDRPPDEYTSLATDSQGRCWLSANCHLLRLPSLDRIERAVDSGRTVVPDTVLVFPNNSRIGIDDFDTIWMWDRQTLIRARLTPDGSLTGQTDRHVEISALLIRGDRVYLCNRGRENILLQRDPDGNVTERTAFPIDPHYDDLSNTTDVFFADDRQNVWIGTRDGLYMLPFGEPHRFVNIRSDTNNPNTLSHSTVSDVCVDGRNTVWVATAHGLNRLTFAGSTRDDYRIERFFDTRPGINTVLNNKIQQIVVDPDGQLWLGTKGGLSIYDPRQNRYHTLPVLDSAFRDCSFVRALCRDSENNLWVGFEHGGVFRYEPASNSVRAIRPESAEPVGCTALAGNSRGTVWIGTLRHGILRHDHATGALRSYPLTDTAGQRPVAIHAIHNDRHNNVWVGTENGLYKYNYDRDEFIRMPIDYADGPRTITGLIGCSHGNLWMSTLSGVYKYNVPEGDCRLFTLYGGNFARQGFVSGGDMDGDGVVYLSGINGLTLFDPGEITADTTRYRVRFTDFRIRHRGAVTDPGIPGAEINYTDRIVLDHRNNRFAFSFAAMTYTRREEIRYSHMLEGFDNDWIYTGSRERTISYDNLPPGRYALKIRGTDAGGVWHEDGHTLSIRVKSPLSATWYFISIYILLLGGAAWFLGYLRRLRVGLRSLRANGSREEIIREKVKRELILNPKEILEPSADDKFLTRSMEVIEKHIADESLTVELFASKMNLSSSMLYRRVKGLTGLSPNELIRSVRMKRAAQLLGTKAYTVSEVAVKVGFTDIRYFRSCFKKAFGVPPSIYRSVDF